MADVEDAVERHVVEGSADVVEVRGRRRKANGTRAMAMEC